MQTLTSALGYLPCFVHYITIMSKEPQLPEFNSNNLITITTDNHVVETTRQDLDKVKSFCDDNKITLDYYMFEFMYYEDETTL